MDKSGGDIYILDSSEEWEVHIQTLEGYIDTIVIDSWWFNCACIEMPCQITNAGRHLLQFVFRSLTIVFHHDSCRRAQEQAPKSVTSSLW